MGGGLVILLVNKWGFHNQVLSLNKLQKKQNKMGIARTVIRRKKFKILNY